MRRLAIAAAIALWTVPAYAQFGMGGGEQRDKTRYTEEQRRTEAEVEQAYKETVKNTRSGSRRDLRSLAHHPAGQRDQQKAGALTLTSLRTFFAHCRS